MKRSKTQRTPSERIDLALSRVGLNEKEATTYLALLELGPSPVRAIAKKTGINRGTTYEVLSGLVNLGLVSYFHKVRHQHFVAEDPGKLIALVESRTQELEQTKRIVSEAVPLLAATTALPAHMPRVRFFEGHAGIRTMLQDVLDTMRRQEPKEYYVYSSADVRKHLYTGFQDFTERRVRHSIAVKTISIGPGGKLSGLDERRWLRADEHAPTYQIIYAGKLALISLDDQDDPVGVIIEDPHTADTQRIIFLQLWAMLKPTAV